MYKKYLVYFFFAYLLLLLPDGLRAFYKVEKFGLDQGLSQSSVYAVLHDSKGFIWVGSADGLNRFDGNSFSTYRFSSSQLLEGASNFITEKLLEDSLHRIWFGTENGIGYYDPNTNLLNKVKLPLPFAVNPCSVISISNGVLWFNNHWLLHGLQLATGKLLTYRIPDVHASFNYVRGFTVQANGNFWISSHKGLVCFYPQSRKFKRVVFPKRFHAKAGGYLKLLCSDTLGNQFLQSYEGIHKYIPNTRELILLNKGLKEYAISGAVFDSCLIVTQLNKGLFFINKQHGKSILSLTSGSQELSLSNLIFTTLCIDNHNNLWVGLDGFGLNKINLNPDRFKLYRSGMVAGWNAKNSFTKNFLEWGDSLLFGTFESGLLCLIRSKQLIVQVPVPSFLGPTITAIHAYNNHQWVVGGSRDILLFEPKNGNYKKAQFLHGKEVTIGELQLFQALPLKQGGIVVSSYYGSFYWNGSLPFVFKKIEGFANHTGALLEDKNQMVWVSSIVDGGVCRYRRVGGQLILKDKILPGYKIRWFWEDKQKGIVWMASALGLIKFNTGNNEYVLYNKQNGFPEDYLYAVLPGHNNELWISNNYGLFAFEPENGKIRIFQKSDGLQSNEFNTYSALRLKSGELVFGGVNGFNLFNPAKIWVNPFSAAVSLTEIKVLDEFRKIPNIYSRKLELPYTENTVTLSFSALEMAEPNGVSTRFMLAGLDKDWVNETQKRQIRYPAIPPGKYQFMVQAANRDGRWGQAQMLLEVVVHPPWWMRWWVIAMELLIGLWILYYLLSTPYRRKIRNQAIELERVKLLHTERERISRDMHDDLGSGLTRIAILSQLLAKPFDEKVKSQQIQKIHETAGELLDNMGNLVWTMNPGYDSLESLLAYIRSFCGKLFDESPVLLSFDFPENIPPTPLKPNLRKSVFLVIKEACNNCLKYSKASKFELTYSIENGKHTIKLVDNGIGFDPKQVRQFGNGLLNMKKRMETAGGTFQLISQPGSGTQITLTF